MRGSTAEEWSTIEPESSRIRKYSGGKAVFRREGRSCGIENRREPSGCFGMSGIVLSPNVKYSDLQARSRVIRHGRITELS